MTLYTRFTRRTRCRTMQGAELSNWAKLVLPSDIVQVVYSPPLLSLNREVFV